MTHEKYFIARKAHFVKNYEVTYASQLSATVLSSNLDLPIIQNNTAERLKYEKGELKKCDHQKAIAFCTANTRQVLLKKTRTH